MSGKASAKGNASPCWSEQSLVASPGGLCRGRDRAGACVCRRTGTRGWHRKKELFGVIQVRRDFKSLLCLLFVCLFPNRV